MKKKFHRIVFLIGMVSICTMQTQAVNTSAASSILIEQESGRVLFAQEEHEPRLIASITKIMTAVVALEHGDLQQTYTVTWDDMVEGSSMYLKPGETLSMEELLYGLMLVSGNDAALAVAHCVSGEVENFVELMNQTARDLGMQDSSFANPNGLDADTHHASAADMATLTAYALKNPHFRRIVSTASITLGERYLGNHNKLLRQYEGCIGVKTGFTKAAGRTLVSAAERQGMTLVCVTLKDGDDWQDHKTLLDYGFQNYRMETAAAYGTELATVLVPNGTNAVVSLAAGENLRYPLTGDEQLTLWAQLPDSVSAPVVPGQEIGTLYASLNGEVVASVPLMATEPSAVREAKETDEPTTFWRRLWN